MSMKHLFYSVLLGTALFTSGCGSTYGGPGYGYGPSYRTYESYYGGGYSNLYYGRSVPYYGYSTYYNRSPWEVRREREQEAANVEHQYEKGMQRLDRQEQEAREKAARQFGGNTADPRYQESLEKIDRKYDHKREKVEHLRKEDYRDLNH